MEKKPRNAVTLIGGATLIGLGLLTLAAEFFGRHGWGALWPFVIIGIGGMFFAGMASGGRNTAPLAIPATIVTGIGVMLFLQNLSGHFESWAYGWTVIVFLAGLGVYLMGVWGRDPGARRGGAGTMRTGAILFVIFGAFFEGLIFRSSRLSDYIFPAALILFGLYLVFKRSGLVSSRKEERPASTDISEET